MRFLFDEYEDKTVRPNFLERIKRYMNQPKPAPIPFPDTTQEDSTEFIQRTYKPSDHVPRESSALDKQIGGSHYANMKIQPAEYIHANGIGYMEGNVIKYVSRWRSKGDFNDLEKAKHYIELLIELELKKIPF